MVDVVTLKRASLGSGNVEALYLLRINKDRMQNDARWVRDLPNAMWKEHISERHSELPQLLPRDFAIDENSFNNPVDRDVGIRYGDTSESDGGDIWFGLFNAFDSCLTKTFLTFRGIWQGLKVYFHI